MKMSSGLRLLLLSMICLGSAWAAQAATYTVTTDADSGAGSLRDQVTLANANLGPDTIIFSGPMCITITSGVISVSDPLLLDGFGQVVLSGNNLLRLVSASQGSTVTGLAFILASGFDAIGLEVFTSCNRIYGCRFGTDWYDTGGLTNYYGMTLHGSFNDVGGTTPAERNIFSGNAIGLQTVSVFRCTIRGNYFGINSTGLGVIANNIGIDADYGTTQTMFGGNRLAGEGNVLGGNSDRGFYVDSTAWGNTVCGNIVGMLPDLSAAAANYKGIELYGAKGNFIGLTTTGCENIVGRNSGKGIILSGNVNSEPTPRWNSVQNNYVGIGPDNTLWPNGSGIYLYHAGNNLIGGDRNANQGNIISGNTDNGIYLEDGYGNTLAGNYVGTLVDGSGAAPNGNGINLGGGWGNCVGGANTGGQFGNLISGNNNYGIVMDKWFFSNPLSDNQILGNRIGLNAAGNAALPNGYSGLYANNCTNTTIGGPDPGSRNVIAGNTQYGIALTGGTGNQIFGNYLGTNQAGTSLLTNQMHALYIGNAAYTTIGGTSSGGNVICGGTGGTLSGIYLSNSSNNTCTANWIGVLATGVPTTPNFTYAVFVTTTSRDNLFGQPAGGPGNLMAGTNNGITVGNNTCIRNSFWTNTICAFSGQGIQLLSGANESKAVPVIQSAGLSLVQGTSGNNDRIQIFVSDRGAGVNGGSLRCVGEGAAGGTGNWAIACTGLQYGDYICATATNADGSTSGFSLNALVSPPHPQRPALP